MPYSWDDQHDFNTQSSQGYSFQDARKSYADVAVARTSGKAYYTFRSPLPETEAHYPVIIGIDTTGSMEKWPEIFFDKLPLLYKEAVRYFPECEISFQAINDYHADGAEVALQPAPFGKGPQLDELIGQLYPAGGGGGQGKESYEIFAAYNSFLKAPKAIIKPVAVILGDEMTWETVPAEVCSALGWKETVTAETAFSRLAQVCDVFLVRKPYHGFGDPDLPIVKNWITVAGIPEERVMNIKDPRRVVDVILGILGILTGKAELFEKELIDRQDQNQVQEVLQSLQSLKASYQVQTHVSQQAVSLNHGLSKQLKTKRLDTDE